MRRTPLTTTPRRQPYTILPSLLTLTRIANRIHAGNGSFRRGGGSCPGIDAVELQVSGH